MAGSVALAKNHVRIWINKIVEREMEIYNFIVIIYFYQFNFDNVQVVQPRNEAASPETRYKG